MNDKEQDSISTVYMTWSVNLMCIYCKVPSSRMSRLIAHPSICRLFMKGKFDAYVLWTLAQRAQNWIVDQSTTCNFTVHTFLYFQNLYQKNISLFLQFDLQITRLFETRNEFQQSKNNKFEWKDSKIWICAQFLTYQTTVITVSSASQPYTTI